MRARFLLLMVPLMFACETSTTPEPQINLPVTDTLYSGSPRRHIPDDVLNRKAICYSGYRTGQTAGKIFPTEAEIREDLHILVEGGWGFIRLFDCTEHAQTVLKVIAADNLDIKVQLGIWIEGPNGDARMTDSVICKQISDCRNLVAQYPDIIVCVSAGNETLDYWSSIRMSANDLARYIRMTRDSVTVPVTTDDSWIPFTFQTDESFSYDTVINVAKEVDYLCLHAYPILDASWGSWDWQQTGYAPGHTRASTMMEAAIGYTIESINQVRQAMAAHGLESVPIIIGEAGWKTFTNGKSESPEDTIRKYLAHEVNEDNFFRQLMAWSYGTTPIPGAPEAIFWFEAFDEPWKGLDSDDDGWGLFTVDRIAKYPMWETFPSRKPANAAAWTDTSLICWPY